MKEHEIQLKFIKWLQKNKIDFVHINNSAFNKRSSSAYTWAFSEPFPCTKYFPDLMFCYNGNNYMIEFGIKGRHSDRKAKQNERMQYWQKNGGVICNTFYDWQSCQELIDYITNERL